MTFKEFLESSLNEKKCDEDVDVKSKEKLKEEDDEIEEDEDEEIKEKSKSKFKKKIKEDEDIEEDEDEEIDEKSKAKYKKKAKKEEVDDDDEEDEEELTESVISKLETAAGKSLRPGEANLGGIDVVLLDAGGGDVDIEVGDKADLNKLSSWLRKNKFKFTKEDDWTVSITS